MSDEAVSAKKIYMDARRLAWFASISLVAVMAASLAMLETAAVPIVTAGLPTLGMLAGAYAAVDRWSGKNV